jgi:Na+-transporting methylmalonyl-CoA/oxaloacetate decarboxylase gamma subunit
MSAMALVPILLVVLVWAIVFVGCFVSFARMLRLPTEPEIEAALAHADASDGTQSHSH